MITVENLSRNYGDFVAVDDVSFTIPRGSVVGLLGHNGAGKTTIMKMLTGYLEPTKGTAKIDDIDVASNRLPVQMKIGYLPENSPIYPELTVVDYLEYVAELRGIPKNEQSEAIKKAITRTQLEEKAADLINTLSRGYRQRVGVAQAVLHEPEILILDEPTNGLDPSQILEMRQLIKDLSEKSTVIISTHILQEVDAVCDRVLIISRGKLVLDRSLDELGAQNQFLVETDSNLSSVKQNLSGISSIKEISELSKPNGNSGSSNSGSSNSGSSNNTFRLALADSNPTSTASITKQLVEKGCNLYAFHREERNLEAIFREVSV